MISTAVVYAILLALSILLLVLSLQPRCVETPAAQLCGCTARLAGYVLHYDCAAGGYIELRGYVCASASSGVRSRLTGSDMCLLLPGGEKFIN
jgi:hypothetical protein